MKLSTLAAMTLVASAPLYAQQDDEKVYNLPVSDPNSPVMLELDVRHGKILVQGGPNENIEVIARTRPLDQEELKNVKSHQRRYQKDSHQTDKPARSREGLTPVRSASLNMEIEQQGNSIEISSEESTYYVELIVNVPQRTNVEADIYRGDGITVSDTIGYMELGSWKGDIVAERVQGPIVAETHQNAIVVSFASFSDSGPSSLTTHSGDIDITVDNSMAANINVQNFQGEVLSGLDVPFEATQQVKRNEGNDRQEIVIGGQLTAKLNGGGQDLTMITYSGDVYVRKP